MSNIKSVRAFGEKLVSISPDGSLLAIGNINTGQVSIYDLKAEPVEVACIEGGHSLQQIVWSLDSRKIATLSFGNNIVYCDLALHGGQRQIWQEYMFDCTAVAFDPGSRLALALPSGEVVALSFDAHAGPDVVTVARVEVHPTRKISALEFDLEGHMYYTIIYPTGVKVSKITRVQDGLFHTSYTLDMPNQTRLHAVAYKQGTVAAILSDGSVQVWRNAIPQDLSGLRVPNGNSLVSFLAVAFDGDIVVCANKDEAVFWSLDDQAERFRLTSDVLPKALFDVECARSAPYCVLVGGIRVMVVEIPGHNESFTVDVAWESDGRRQQRF